MTDKSLRYTLRISPALMEKFSYVAEYNGRTKNKEIEQMIRKCIEVFEKEHGEIESSTSKG